MKSWARRLLLCVAVFGCTAASAQAVTVQQWNTPGGKLISRKDLFPRDLVNGKLVTNVVLPTGYSSRQCWPVMYLLHGTADSPQPVSLQWLQIDNGALLKMKIPAILVIPGSGDSWWVNNWWNGYRHPAFESWVLQDIVPLVAKRLHVCPQRSDHVMAGLSMGGYGAMYLASQLPGYFGSAGSFSGVLSPESPSFLSIFPAFPTYWGPAGKPYAVAHDPVALVDNLRHTRVFVGVGNGDPTEGETSDLIARVEEAEFDVESRSFVARARQAGVSVHFDQHVGTHAPLNWIQTLARMMAWHPFKSVPAHPSSWTFSTIETTGNAWGYQFAFSRYAPPKQIIQFSMAHGVLHVRGGGTVTITQPNGKRVSGQIPFDLRNGKVIERHGAAAPRLVGGYEKLMKVSVAVSPAQLNDTQPVTLSFKTRQRLTAGQVYRVGLFTVAPKVAGCTSEATTEVAQRAKGRTVKVTLAPPANATTPNTWCSGTSYAGVTVATKNAPGFAIGSVLGYTKLTFP
jgi:S-formylglutathione hydrolase FrmB